MRDIFEKTKDITRSSLMKGLDLKSMKKNLKLDEDRILRAKENAEKEGYYDAEDVWKKLDI